MSTQPASNERQCLPLGDLLVSSGILSVEELIKAREEALLRVEPLEDILRREKNVTEALLREIVAEQCQPQAGAENDGKTTANEKKGKRNTSIVQHLWSQREKQKALRAARRAENTLLRMQREMMQTSPEKQKELSPLQQLLLREKSRLYERWEKYRKEQIIRREKHAQERAIRLQEQKQREEEMKLKREELKKKQEEDRRKKEEEARVRREEEKRQKEEARLKAEAEKKRIGEEKLKAQAEAKQRRMEEKKRAAEAKFAKREAKRAKRAERDAQRALARAAQEMARNAGQKGGTEPAEHRLIEEARQEAVRQVLIEHEKQKIQTAQQSFTMPASAVRRAGEGRSNTESISAVLVDSPENVIVSAPSASFQREGAPQENERQKIMRQMEDIERVTKPETSGKTLLEDERRQFSQERSALLRRIQELESEQTKITASPEEVTGEQKKLKAELEVLKEEQSKLLLEKEALEKEKKEQPSLPTNEERKKLLAEAEAVFLKKLRDQEIKSEAEKKELEKKLTSMKGKDTDKKKIDMDRALLLQEAKREAGVAFEKERTEWEIEKGRIKQQAIADAEAQFLGTMKKGAGLFGGKHRETLSKEIVRWKKEAEKLEKERIALEREKVLLSEGQRMREEKKQMEEEKVRLAREKLAVEKQALSTSEEEEKTLAEQKNQLAEEQKELDQAKHAKKWKKLKGKKEKKEEKEGGGEGTEQEEKKSTLDIGKILIAQNYLEEAEFQSAKQRADEQKVSVETVLREEGLVTKDILQNAIAEYYHMPFVDVSADPPDTSVVELLPEELALSLHATAIEKKGTTLVIATSSPERGEEITGQIVGTVEGVEKVEMVYTSKDAIDSALSFYRKPLNTRFQAIISEHKKIAPEIIEEIFADAIQLGASDIHFEPQEKIVIVRFRVDGVMHEAGKIPREYYEGIVNRIKIAGNMRIDEHFAAQDGAIRWKHSGNEKAMDVRVSIVPIVDGEKIVMRLLSEYVRTLTLRDLGFAGEHLNTLVKMAHKPFGMILTTGPTGSGKSTTLYGLLKIRNSPDVNISTIEDPVEYKIPGINHIQVNTKANLTFERGLRALVRQDPDIILVGEIRDDITAQISVNAALTGHLVFSTLHANDAATAVPRLLEMGIESYLLASTLEVIIAQRLLRRSCMSCRYSYNVSTSEARKLFPYADRYFKGTEEVTLFKGKGCGNCGNTGFKGRVGVYELLVITPEIEEMITNRRTSGEINILARRQGMLTLFEDGLQKALSGLSTIEELLRIAAPPDPLSEIPS